MKKSVVFSLVVAFVIALAPVRGAAEDAPCKSNSRAKRAVSGAVTGGVIGGLLGVIVNGKNGLKNGAIIGAGIGGTAAGFQKTQPCTAAALPASRRASGQPQTGYRKQITSRNDRQEIQDDSEALFIRNINGPNQNTLLQLVGDGLYQSGYQLVDRQQYQSDRSLADSVAYTMDIQVTQVTQGSQNGYASLYGRTGNINLNPQSISSAYIVTVTTYRHGRYAPELSATTTVSVVQRGGSFQVNTRNFQTGNYSFNYAVDPYTVAAYRAISEIFSLPR